MPHPCLPPELFGVIIERIGQSEGDGRIKSLAVCCLADRTILSFAREHLYRDVSLLVHDSCDLRHCHHSNSDSESGHSFPTSRRLIDTLTSAPHLAILVKSLKITATRGTSAPALQVAVKLAIQACAETEQLSLDLDDVRPASGWLERAVTRFRGNLVSLRVEGKYHWTPELFRLMLERQDFLRHLRLDPLDGINVLPTPAPIELETFTVSDYLDVTFLDHLIRRSRRSLKNLRLVGFGAAQSFDFSSYTALVSISIHFALSDIDQEDLRLLFVSVSSIPSLHSLAFELDWGRMHGDFYLVRLERIKMLHLLPPSLRSLTQTGWIPFSTCYLLASLADKSCLPAVQHLALSSGILEDGELVRNRSREELEQIQKLADRRGIEIAWTEAEEESDEELYNFEEQGNFID